MCLTWITSFWGGCEVVWEWLHLLWKYLEWAFRSFGCLPFLEALERRRVGKGKDLSDTRVKLFMSVNSDFYLFICVCVLSKLPSCLCLYLLHFVSERHSSPWSIFGKWVTWSEVLLYSQYVTSWIYWFASPRNLHFANSSSNKNWKSRG